MSKQDQTNMLIADFRKMPKKVKDVKELEAEANARGLKLERKPLPPLEPCWIAWHQSHVG